MATIKDVARVAGVGLGTASRVISGNGSVAPATVARVKAAIAQLGFRPSHTARALLSGMSHMIGVYIPILKGTFYTPLLRLVDTELRENGQHMVVAFGSGSGNARKQAREGIEFLADRGCDGILVLSNALRDEDMTGIRKLARPIALVNHSLPSLPEQSFVVDHAQGGRLAAQTLLEAGHRRIALVGGPGYAPDNTVRVNAFLSELSAAGIPRSRVPRMNADFSPEGGRAAAEVLLKRPLTCSAVFCANDEMAVGVLSYCQQAGIAVPAELSVMGYDDVESAAYTAPQLTTVHMPWREVTLDAVRWLLNTCYQTELPLSRKYEVSVMYRRSVSAPAFS